MLNELKEADNPEMWLIDYFPDLLTSLEEFNLLSEDALKLPINLQEILRYVPDKSIRPVLFDEIKTTLLIKNIEQGE
ncbi:MAG: hypothetical protein LH606_15405 [Cytophagaceae bacterium]|nr:hypothetical protein [Cytophagaceae bacterium]